MGWHLLETVLQQVGEHSTLVGKLWVTATFVFRFIIVASVGDAVYSDEQSDFNCNTQQPGCENVCYNKFSPISHLRFWAAQIICVSTPSILFVVYTMHMLLKMPQEEPEGFGDQEMMPMDNAPLPPATPQIPSKKKKGGKSGGSFRRSDSNTAPRDRIGFVRGITNPPAEATEIIEDIKEEYEEDDPNEEYDDEDRDEEEGGNNEVAETEKLNELDRELALLDSLAPSPDAKEKRIKKSIQVAYVIALLLRTGTEAVFIWLQIDIYGFTVPEIYKCWRFPCPNIVDCFISRPREKTILLWFMFAVSVACLLLNVIEIKYFGFKRLKKVLCHGMSATDDDTKLQDDEEKGDTEDAQSKGSKDNYFNVNGVEPSAPPAEPNGRLCSVVKFPDDDSNHSDKEEDSIGISRIGERPSYPIPGYPYVHRYGMFLDAVPPQSSYL